MKKFFKLLVAVVVTASMASCSDDDEVLYVSTDDMSAQCTNDGVWSACYTNAAGYDLSGLHFSHYSMQSPYTTWSGFCPSTVKDTGEYSDSEWVDHQWATIVGHPAAGANATNSYMVAYWDSWSENSCSITGTNGISFKPYELYVSNTTWSYYAMLNGTAYNEAFDSSSWFKLTITAYKDDATVGTINVMLYEDGTPLKDWKKVDLTGFGIVDMLDFTLTSSDTGEWGMNNPAYFCIDGLTLY